MKDTFSNWRLICIVKDQDLKVFEDRKVIGAKRIANQLTKTTHQSILTALMIWKSQVLVQRLDWKANNEKKLVGAKRIANQLASTTHQII